MEKRQISHAEDSKCFFVDILPSKMWRIATYILSVKSTWWLSSKEGKKGNFTEERHDKHRLSPVIKVGINSGKSRYYYVLFMWCTLPLWASFSKPVTPVESW